ncbi:MAG TPA: hypothetical protein VFO29_08360 [Candidatus Rubrimentiphilum sp.]|nr:hypothetical protein [Candidatus Rubrimentiphilum sp.]
MRAIASLLLLSLVVAVAPADNAPADKYFGRLKMSALRIRYEIAQIKSRYDNHKLLPEEAEHLAAFAAESYYEWAAQFPRDGWLGSTGINLAKLYEDLPGASARTAAIRALTFVRRTFKNTRYSKQAASELSRGVALKSYPAWAVTLRATPSPSPMPSGKASPAASTSPRSLPSPSPTR